MSILGIVGSPRKNGLTAQAVQKTLEGAAQSGSETEILYLADFHIQPCRDCHPTLKCRESDGCYHKDDFETISRKIDEACGLVLGTAVYYGDITRIVDNLLNKKVRHRKERPREGIPGIGIAVAGGGGGGYASALRHIYHYFRIIGFQGLKPIPVTRFNLSQALDEAFQAGANEASLIAKEYFTTGFQRTSAYLDLPILGFDYLEERFYLIEQIIKGAQKRPEKSIKEVEAIYKKAEELKAKKDKAGAFAALEEAYKLGTEIWNPQRQ
ncbi:MAG: flavodoxin family protein [Candidatus Bathyarchaeota archaeon]